MRPINLLLILILIVMTAPAAAQDDGIAVILGEEGFVTDMAWSPDGQILAASTLNGIALYDKNLALVRLMPNDDPFNTGGSVDWSPDGSMIVSRAGINGITMTPGTDSYIWDVAANSIRFTYQAEQSRPPSVMLWNHNSDRIFFTLRATDMEPLEALVWDAQTGDINRAAFPIDVTAETLRGVEWAWAADDATIIGTSDTLRLVMDASSLQLLEQATPTAPAGNAASISPDGSSSATLDSGIVTVTNGDGLSFELRGDEAEQFRGMREFAWSADSRMIVAWGRATSPDLIVADVATGEHLLELSASPDGDLTQVSLNAASDRLVTTNFRSEIAMYALPSAELIAQAWFRSAATSISLSPDGSMIATVNASGPLLYLWDAATGDEIRAFNAGHEPGEMSDLLYSVAWSPDGQHIATGSNRGGVVTGSSDLGPIDLLIWDVASGEIAQMADAQARDADFILHLEWSADSQLVAFSTLSNQFGQSRAGVWDVGQAQMRFQHEPEAGVVDIALSPDGDRLVMNIVRLETGRITLVTVDTQDGAVLSEMAYDPAVDFVRALDWHPNGQWLAVVEDVRQTPNHVSIWDWQNGGNPKLMTTIELAGDNHRALLEWSPVGDRFAATYINEDEQAFGVQVWQVTPDGQSAELVALREVAYVRPPIMATPAWSADGSRIALGTATYQTVIFDAP